MDQWTNNNLNVRLDEFYSEQTETFFLNDHEKCVLEQ